MAQWSGHLQLKQEGLGSIPGGSPGFFHFQLSYTNIDGMKDQQRYEWGEGSVVL